MRTRHNLRLTARVLTHGRNLLRGLGLYLRRRRLERQWLATQDIEPRIRDVLACPILARIPKVENAGQIEDGVLTMHNGIKVLAGSYSGDPMTRLLSRTGGVHEPQEEVVFAEVLKTIPPGSTMLELGAWWGFYSMWFQKEIPQARNILLEPVAKNLEFGKANFALNRMEGEFMRAASGAGTDRSSEPPVFAVDDLLDDLGIDRLAILHADIQGAELDMLRGAQRSIASGRINWLFISTHTHALHYACRDLLTDCGCEIAAEADLLDTCSYDGVIVASPAGRPPASPSSISS